MKSNGLTATIFTAAILFCTQIGTAASDLYVSPRGDDANQGTKRAPFATLQRARDATRMLSAEDKKEGITIHLKKGIHPLSEALILTSADSGYSAEAPVIWSGEKGSVISGGKEITGWVESENGIWKTRIDWLQAENLFYSLFADGKRLTRARTPDAGTYHYTQQLLYDKKSGRSCTGMIYYPETIPDDIQSSDAHIVLFHKWVSSQNFVQSIDKKLNKIMFTSPAGIFLFDPESRFYVEGVRSALTSPGEWFLDPQNKELLLIPPQGMNPNKMEIIAPVVRTALVQIKGNSKGDEKVKNLIFEKISFEYADANIAKGHPKSVQGAHVQRGAFNAEGMQNSIIRDCTFTRIGENGICLLNGCRNNLIERNHIYDMGCGGVYMPEQKPGKLTENNLCGYNTVCENLIHDGGIIFRAGVGVFLGGNASYNKVLHNEIFNLSWMGVHAGWSWSGLAATATHHNNIGFNHIHHIGNGVLCDIGGIYTIGVSTGTVLHNNLIHDITRYTRGRTGYGAWGIYNDAGSSQITVTSNVVYNTQDGGYHLHNDGYPWGDKAYNNIFAIADSAQLKRGNIKDTTNGLHLVFENNIVYCTNNLTYGGGNWKTNSVFSCNYNCFYSTSDKALDFAGYDFRTWQKAGKDVNSMIANPMFKDAEHYDFHISPLSPAITLGFKPFDYTLAGLSKGNPLRKLVSKYEFRPIEVAPVDNRPFKLDEGFETSESGDSPRASYVSKRVDNKGFFVSAEQAATGRHSLKVADGPGLKYSYDPHLCYNLPSKDGTWKVAFDMFHTKGAKINFESREYPKGEHFQNGPSFQVKGDSTITVGNKKFTIKPNTWTSFEILCTQGDGVWATWELKINAGMSDEQSYFGFVSNAAFKELTWFGFISPDKKESVVYIDNLIAEML
ncbi:MAG: right-handed parallel beta-helix repeat-containing protein [Kiritimatiellae bacterium]|jgi:hypothetical protein|nr:right-handed parallel beta-helix repeat-containing protein [Kiritimatiellia bacterium]